MILRGPKISGVRTISNIFVGSYACIFVLVQVMLFYYATNKRSLKNRDFQTFWSEDHISYYTTVRGSDILRNVIVSVYVIFYQIKKFFVN